MEEYAARFADLIDGLVGKIRSLTIDRIAKGVRITGLGILAATFAFTSVLFLVWSIFGALEIPLTTAGAFGVFAAILIGGGVFLWMKRS